MKHMDKLEKIMALLIEGMADAKKEIEIIDRIDAYTGNITEKQTLKYSFYNGVLASYQNVYETLEESETDIPLNTCEN
jgi:hypothetical protein